MVPGIIQTMVEEKKETYAERLRAAMADAGVSVEQLAAHLGVTRQAVKKLVAGLSAEMTATNNSKTAIFLGVDSDVLALGMEGVSAARGSGREPNTETLVKPPPSLSPDRVSRVYANLAPSGREVFIRLLDVAGLLPAHQVGDLWPTKTTQQGSSPETFVAPPAAQKRGKEK